MGGPIGKSVVGGARTFTSNRNPANLRGGYLSLQRSGNVYDVLMGGARIPLLNSTFLTSAASRCNTP